MCQQVRLGRRLKAFLAESEEENEEGDGSEDQVDAEKNQDVQVRIDVLQVSAQNVSPAVVSKLISIALCNMNKNFNCRANKTGS